MSPWQVLAELLAALAAIELVVGLVITIRLMLDVSDRLATIYLLLRSISERTAPVDEYVAGIGSNVHALDSATAELENLARTGSS